MANKKIRYSEPVDFIPKSVRKELGLGEFAPATAQRNTSKSDSNKSGGKKSK